MLEFLLPILNSVIGAFFTGIGFWAAYVLVEKYVNRND